MNEKIAWIKKYKKYGMEYLWMIEWMDNSGEWTDKMKETIKEWN